MGDNKNNVTGVLLVHGIGEQNHRDTLLQFGQPIIDWLKRHIELDDEIDPSKRIADTGEVRVHHPGYLNGNDTSEIPESVVVEICQDNEGTTHKEQWILTETWWANVFEKPLFASLAKWIFMIAPWLALSHVARRDRIEKRNFIFRILRLLFAFAIASVIQIIVIVLSLLAIIPIPKLRSMLSGFLSKITATLGDAYVLVSSPIQKAAAIRKVLDGIDWLEQHCDSIVVVAHSQGAAIASEALRQCENKKVKKLITYGSGLSKLLLLTEIEFQKNKPIKSLPQILDNKVEVAKNTTPIFFILMLMMPIYFPYLPGIDLSVHLPFSIKNYLYDDVITLLNWVPVSLVYFYIAVFISVIMQAVWYKNVGYTERLMGLYNDIKNNGVSWVNIYSTHDPVSNGKMELEESGNFKQIETNNLRSVFSDHTSYWSNQDEFITSVVREVDNVGTGAVTRITENKDENIKVIESISNRRGRHIGMLSWYRLSLFISLTFVSYIMSSDLVNFGLSIIDTLNTSSEFELAESLIIALGIMFESASKYIGLNENQLILNGSLLIGCIFVFLAGYLWNIIFMYIWKEYDESRGRDSPLYCLATSKMNFSELRRIKYDENYKSSGIKLMMFIPAVLAFLHYYFGNFEEVWLSVTYVSASFFFFFVYLLFALLSILLTLHSIPRLYKYVLNRR